MGKKLNLKGKKFNNLLIIKQIGLNKENKAVWECLCDCGNKTTAVSSRLVRGAVKSCGCRRGLANVKRCTKHGQSKAYNHTVELTAWQNMKIRCYNKKNSHYHSYGGRGIIVCDRWLGKRGFENFFKDMGSRPSRRYSIDRFPNKNGNYESTNCRWATPKQQAANKTTNRWIEYRGKIMILSDWARSLKCRPNQLSYFIKKGKNIGDVKAFLKSKKYGKKKTA